MSAIKNLLLLAAFVLTSTLCGNLTADSVVYDLDFETESSTDDYNPNYDQADPGGVSTKTYDANGGAGGTRGLRVDFDLTGSSPFSVSYFTNLGSSSLARRI